MQQFVCSREIFSSHLETLETDLAHLDKRIGEIEQAIDTIEDLSDKKLLAPALLMAWATLEGLGRALLSEKLVRPQTPGRILM
jgi:hypothetical protein